MMPLPSPKILPAMTSTIRSLDQECRDLELRLASMREQLHPSRLPRYERLEEKYLGLIIAYATTTRVLYQRLRQLSVAKWRKVKGGAEEEQERKEPEKWLTTTEAHTFMDKMAAAAYEHRAYCLCKEKTSILERPGLVRTPENARLRPRDALLPQTIFQVTQMGTSGASETTDGGEGVTETLFRERLLTAYDAVITDPPESGRPVHDSATGGNCNPLWVTAAHLVPADFPAFLSESIFRFESPWDLEDGGLDSANNGVLVHLWVKAAMDDGAIAIVPNLPDDAPPHERLTWHLFGPHEYKWLVMDPDADCVWKVIECKDGAPTKRVRDLHDTKLSFRNGPKSYETRPHPTNAAFAFVIALLKQAWRRRDRHGSLDQAWRDEQYKKARWALFYFVFAGSFLKALGDEIGWRLGPQPILSPSRERSMVDDMGMIGIAKWIQGASQGQTL